MGTNRSGKNRYARIRRAKKNMETRAGTGEAGKEARSGEEYWQSQWHTGKGHWQSQWHTSSSIDEEMSRLETCRPAEDRVTACHPSPQPLPEGEGFGQSRLGGDLGDRRFFFARFFGQLFQDFQQHVGRCRCLRPGLRS